MRITRGFIAKKAGVSPAAISGVLNNNPNARVSPETREKIIKLAKKYNYFPNVLARSLAMKKTFNIGLINTVPVASFLNDPFNNSIFVGIESEIEKNGYSFLFSLLKSDADINFSVRKMIMGNIVDGIILFRRIEGNLKKLLQESKTNFVLIDNYYEDLPSFSILPDNLEGAYKAVQYLIEKGNRKIYCVNGNEDHPSYRERPAGYAKAMQENGLQTKILSTAPDILNTKNMIMEFLKEKDIPDAFFVTGDHMAVGTIRALKSAGLRVPDDVRLVGFDNTYLTENEDPGITAVDIPKIEMGEKAVKLLLEEKKEHVLPKIFRIKTSLVIRKTA